MARTETDKPGPDATKEPVPAPVAPGVSYVLDGRGGIVESTAEPPARGSVWCSFALTTTSATSG